MTEVVPISSIQSDPVNARKHDQKNLDAITGSLARFGQQKPIVVDRNNVVRAGNGTLAAAKALGWVNIEVRRTELEGSEATAFALADNRSAELAAWDDEILSTTLKALEGEGFPIADIGFGDFDFSVPPASMNTVWRKADPENVGHPTQKPVALAEEMLKGISGSIIDLFLGSGSTLIACEKTGRRCFGMEIDPHYGDVILKRWEDFTGKVATLESVKDAENA